MVIFHSDSDCGELVMEPPSMLHRRQPQGPSMREAVGNVGEATSWIHVFQIHDSSFWKTWRVEMRSEWAFFVAAFSHDETTCRSIPICKRWVCLKIEHPKKSHIYYKPCHLDPAEIIPGAGPNQKAQEDHVKQRDDHTSDLIMWDVCALQPGIHNWKFRCTM